ncbi:hypothetical protein C8R44DRAFT_740258 [Mycena epipterygia]|nr:hypothetical protein C8R44DRAFT_740258 [Mycena epipterygia]
MIHASSREQLPEMTVAKNMSGPGHQHLPVTELEVATLAFAIVNIFIWSHWWVKPLDVEQPIMVLELGKLGIPAFAYCHESVTAARKAGRDLVLEIRECKTWNVICGDPEHLRDKAWREITACDIFRVNIVYGSSVQCPDLRRGGATGTNGFQGRDFKRRQMLGVSTNKSKRWLWGMCIHIGTLLDGCCGYTRRVGRVKPREMVEEREDASLSLVINVGIFQTPMICNNAASDHGIKLINRLQHASVSLAPFSVQYTVRPGTLTSLRLPRCGCGGPAH